MNSSLHNWWAILGVLPFAILAATAGCGRQGPETATVSGRVTIDGQPVPKGCITFSPAGHGPVTGALIVDGQFRCERVPLGTQTVSFQAQAAEMREILDVSTDTLRQVPQDILPARYRDGQSVEIQAGEVQLDFELRGQDPPEHSGAGVRRHSPSELPLGIVMACPLSHPPVGNSLP